MTVRRVTEIVAPGTMMRGAVTASRQAQRAPRSDRREVGQLDATTSARRRNPPAGAKHLPADATRQPLFESSTGANDCSNTRASLVRLSGTPDGSLYARPLSDFPVPRTDPSS